jgi:hypothetical protein
MIRAEVFLTGASGRWPVQGYVAHEGAPLAVTPSSNGGGWKITHTPSGRALWPNELTLVRCQLACAALLELNGWDRVWDQITADEVFRQQAETIMRRFVR